MNSKHSCPRCGAELPSGTPPESCPRCLLKLGLAFDEDGEPEMVVTGRPSAPPPAPALLAPDFPQLEILEIVGQGGMGVVYKARQKGLDRLVALKLLYVDVRDDAAFAGRFSREARALASLAHPNVVTVFDSGHTNGRYWLLMEYVDGTNLRHLIRAGTVPAAEALAIVSQVCEALQFAHDEGVVHRDIKPENILVDRRGRVKIADFGLAKLLGRVADPYTLTGTHQAMGTPHYMAPEQVEHPTDVDHRADIYSLGVVFYELLTGELPLGRFGPPSERVRVDVRLDEVVLRTLEKDPQRRYQHASEVKTRVDEISSGPGAAAAAAPTVPNGAAKGHRRRRRERRLSVPALVLVVLVLAVLFLGGMFAVGTFFLFSTTGSELGQATPAVPPPVPAGTAGGTVSTLPSHPARRALLLPASALRPLRIALDELWAVVPEERARLGTLSSETRVGEGYAEGPVEIDLSLFLHPVEGMPVATLIDAVDQWQARLSRYDWLQRLIVPRAEIADDVVAYRGISLLVDTTRIERQLAQAASAGVPSLPRTIAERVSSESLRDSTWDVADSRETRTFSPEAREVLDEWVADVRIETGAELSEVLDALAAIERRAGSAAFTSLQLESEDSRGEGPPWSIRGMALQLLTLPDEAATVETAPEPKPAEDLPVLLLDEQLPSALRALHVVRDALDRVVGPDGYRLRRVDAVTHDGVGPGNAVEVAIDLDILAPPEEGGEGGVPATRLYTTFLRAVREHPWVTQARTVSTTILEEPEKLARIEDLRFTFAGDAITPKAVGADAADKPALAEAWVREVAQRPGIALAPLTIARHDVTATDLALPGQLITSESLQIRAEVPASKRAAVDDLLEAIEMESAAAVVTGIHARPRDAADGGGSGEARWDYELVVARMTARPVAETIGTAPPAEVTLPTSAGAGLGLVLDLLEQVPEGDERIELRAATASTLARGLGPEERIEMMLELDFLAGDAIASTGLVSRLEERLRAQPWLRDLDRSGTKVIADGTGVRVPGLRMHLGGSDLPGRIAEAATPERPALDDVLVRRVAAREAVGIGPLDIERSRSKGPGYEDTLLHVSQVRGGEPVSMESVRLMLEAVDLETANGAVVNIRLLRHPAGTEERVWALDLVALTRVSAPE